MTRRLALAILCSVVLATCDAEPAPTPSGPGSSSLAGTSWTLVSVNGRLPVPGTPPTLVFTDTDASGTGGCNGYGGKYRYDPGTGSIAFLDLGMTLMLCSDNGRNVVESAFFGALTAANGVAVDAGGRLHLAGAGGELVLVSGVRPRPTD
jgi:heat shock protein HslJ